MVNVLDCVRIDGLLLNLATTQTGVGTVPDVTAVVTSPLMSDVAWTGESVMPPGALAGKRLKLTSTPALPLLLLSTTLNFIRELFGNVGALAVFVPIMDGVADINWILLISGGTTVMVTDLEFPVTDAVITSEPIAQLLSL